MRKKILVFVMIVAVIMPCALMFSACNRTGEGSDLILTGGSRPDYDSLFTSEGKAKLDAALAEDASAELKKQAVMTLFDTANYSRKNTSLSLMLQHSDAGISLGDVIMNGFNLKSGDKWYYQLATQATTGNEAFDVVMNAFAGLLKVAYTSGDGDYWYSMVKGSISECDCTVPTFPYATYVLTQEPTKYDEESFKEELHYLDSMHEINNLQFCEEILSDEIELTYDSEYRFYTVKFSVDMNSDAELIERWYSMAQKDMQVSGNSIKKYNYYDAELQVWDNGYAKSFRSESSRDAGMASGKPVDEFTYLWKKSEIMQLLHEDKSVELSTIMTDPEDFILYYSHPTTIKGSLNKSVVGLIIAGSLIAALILGCIITIIVVNVLVKNGKLPKIAAKREAKRDKREAKKAAKRAKKRGDYYDYDDDDDAPKFDPERTYIIDEPDNSSDNE